MRRDLWALAGLLTVLCSCGGGTAPPPQGPPAENLDIRGTWHLQVSHASADCPGQGDETFDAVIDQQGTALTIAAPQGTFQGTFVGSHGSVATLTVADPPGFTTFLPWEFDVNCAATAFTAVLPWTYSTDASGRPQVCNGTDTVGFTRELPPPPPIVPSAPPRVVGFSPAPLPIDPGTGHQAPTLTDAALVQGTDPQHPGKIAVFFAGDTVLEPSSLFVGGDPALGLDASAIQVVKVEPGIGLVFVPVATEVLPDRILFQPLPPYSIDLSVGCDQQYQTTMPDGQYVVRVLRVLNTEHEQLVESVQHSFFVGSQDTVPPFVLFTHPSANEILVTPSLTDVVIEFDEAIAVESLAPKKLVVFDVTGAPFQLTPAPGFPMLARDLAVPPPVPWNGHSVVWRSGAALAPNHTYQVKVLGLDPDGGGVPANPNVVTDLAGNSLVTTHTVSFQTGP